MFFDNTLNPYDMWLADDEKKYEALLYHERERHKWIQQLKKNNRRNKRMRRHMKGGRG